MFLDEKTQVASCGEEKMAGRICKHACMRQSPWTRKWSAVAIVSRARKTANCTASPPPSPHLDTICTTCFKSTFLIAYKAKRGMGTIGLTGKCC